MAEQEGITVVGSSAEIPVSQVGAFTPYRLRWWSILPAFIPFLILLLTSYQGLNYGYHWDEDRVVVGVEGSFHTGVMMPITYYNHGGVQYLLGMVAAIPQIPQAIHLRDSKAQHQGELTTSILDRYFESTDFYVRGRAVFAFVSCLIVFWMYLLILRWRRSIWLALLGACAIGFSWQIAYHARWMVPDDAQMAFSGLALACAFEILWSKKPRFWMNMAAIATGVAIGAKYPAVVMLIPVLIGANHIFGASLDKVAKRRLFMHIFWVMLAAYLVTTPGTIFVPARFVQDVLYEMKHYQRGHYGHSITPGLQGLKEILMFMFVTVFSKYTLIAVFFSAFSLVGSFAIWKESKTAAYMLFVCPAIFILYMMMQHVFIIRNILLLVPFMTVLMALGVEYVWKKLPHVSLRGVMALAIGASVALNGSWLITAAATIPHRDPKLFVQQLIKYVGEHSDKEFMLSPRLAAAVKAESGSLPSNATSDLTTKADYLALYPIEGYSVFQWPALDYNLIVTQFGTWEVDFNYYPDWQGPERIVLLTMSKAKSLTPPMPLIAKAQSK